MVRYQVLGTNADLIKVEKVAHRALHGRINGLKGLLQGRVLSSICS